MKYYVYEWFIKDTGEIIYVGKGTRNRFKVKKHNRFFNDMIKRFDCDSRIIKEFENEKDAFEYEFDRINELRSIGQCVCNIYNGGTGGTTSWWDEDRKKWYSEHNAMKSEKQRQRMSENNPMQNEETRNRVSSKKCRPVIINEREFHSVKSVMKEYGVSHETVKKWCEKGINPIGEKCRYKDSQQIHFEGKRYNKGGCKPLIYKGEKYESALDLSKILGVHNSTVCNWAKKGFDPHGSECRYINDHEEHVFEKWINGETSKKPICVNGIWYQSRTDAEKKLGLPRGYFSPSKVNSRKNHKYTCIYDNQQPSQTKSDNSSLEGSETNE